MSPAEEPADIGNAADTRFAGLGDAALQSVTLESLAGVQNYHKWLTDLALPYLGDDPIEIGSGLGDYAATWIAAGIPRVTVTDLEPHRFALLRKRFADEPRVTVDTVDLFDRPKGNYSCLVSYNVLEHIEHDIAALSAGRDLLAPGAAVLSFVPAFPFAMGRFDRQVGHFRRYTKGTLRQAYESAGLTIEQIRYVNAPGLLAWWAGVRLLRMTPGDSPIVQLWDRVITRSARALEDRIAPPFGQSVFAVGRTPA